MEYKTTHNTTDRTMTHDMGAGYTVLADFKTQKVITSRNGKVIDKISMEDITLNDYESHLGKIAEIAETMTKKGFANG